LPMDPLIFVEVALEDSIPGAIAPILNRDHVGIDPNDASTAVFYSISNCQKGLRGISFGNFLIKQVVSELQAELPNLDTFVTLSPVPRLRAWAEAELDNLPEDDQKAIRRKDGPTPQEACRIAARYLTGARRPQGTAFDPVAHFHLGNGAQLHRINARADLSDNGRASGWGVMVNYLYDEGRIEANHQAYANKRTIATSDEVRKLCD